MSGDLEMGPRIAWSNGSQHPQDLNWRCLYSLRSRLGSPDLSFVVFFFHRLNSDFWPYFLPPTSSLPYFGTSVYAERHCSSLQALEPTEVENLCFWFLHVHKVQTAQDSSLLLNYFFQHCFSYYSFHLLSVILDPRTTLVPMMPLLLPHLYSQY